MLIPHGVIFLIKFTSSSCNKRTPQHDVATTMLHRWDGTSIPVFFPNVMMVIVAKMFNFSFMKPQSMDPKGRSLSLWTFSNCNLLFIFLSDFFSRYGYLHCLTRFSSHLHEVFIFGSGENLNISDRNSEYLIPERHDGWMFPSCLYLLVIVWTVGWTRLVQFHNSPAGCLADFFLPSHRVKQEKQCMQVCFQLTQLSEVKLNRILTSAQSCRELLIWQFSDNHRKIKLKKMNVYRAVWKCITWKLSGRKKLQKQQQ